LEIIGVGSLTADKVAVRVFHAERQRVKGGAINDRRRRGGASTVDLIAQQGGVGLVEVHAYLMGAARLEVAFYKTGSRLVSLKDSKMSYGATCASGTSRKSHPFSRVSGMTGIEGALVVEARTEDQGVVGAFGAVIAKLIGQMPMGSVGLGYGQCARRVAVKAVNDAGTQVGTY
jgi:hypothetical protein